MSDSFAFLERRRARLEATRTRADLPTRLPGESLQDLLARARRVREARDPLACFRNADGTVHGLEDLERSSPSGRSTSALAQRVHQICDELSLLEIYDALLGLKREPEGGRTESIKVTCPFEGHRTEQNPSAWVNTDKDLLTCGHSLEGLNKFGLAAEAWGIPNTPADFWTIKKRLAKELRGFDYDAESAKVESAALQVKSTNHAVTPDHAVETTGDVDSWQRKLEERTNHYLLESTARRRARQIENSGLFVVPKYSDNLNVELAEEDPEVEWTVDGLHSVGGNTTLTAGFKVGKTTLVMNLVKALADQEPFLGTHQVRPLEGRVAYLNFEVESSQMKRSFREMGIRNLERILHIPLRGHNFDLMSDVVFEWLSAEMKRQEIEVLIVDPFSGAYYGDENDNSQINLFTKRVDLLKLGAGALDLFMPVHTGRYVEEGNERARGGAKLDDWADHRWVLARQPDTGDRYFRAEGRRVEQQERELLYDRATNTLTYSAFAGSRKNKTGHVLKRKVLAHITANPGCGAREIRDARLGRTDAVGQAIKQLVDDLEVERRQGAGNKVHHYAAGTAPVGPP